jgi:ABC-type branched-subunit amino acid transport system permease subunit
MSETAPRTEPIVLVEDVHTYYGTRLRDIYFAITTLIFSQIFYVIIFTWTEVTGGENGLIFSRPHFTIPFLYDTHFSTATLHWFVLAVVRPSAWCCSRSAKTRRVRGQSAIRSSATRSWQ